MISNTSIDSKLDAIFNLINRPSPRHLDKEKEIQSETTKLIADIVKRAESEVETLLKNPVLEPSTLRKMHALNSLPYLRPIFDAALNKNPSFCMYSVASKYFQDLRTKRDDKLQGCELLSRRDIYRRGLSIANEFYDHDMGPNERLIELRIECTNLLSANLENKNNVTPLLQETKELKEELGKEVQKIILALIRKGTKSFDDMKEDDEIQTSDGGTYTVTEADELIEAHDDLVKAYEGLEQQLNLLQSEREGLKATLETIEEAQQERANISPYGERPKIKLKETKNELKKVRKQLEQAQQENSILREKQRAQEADLENSREKIANESLRLAGGLILNYIKTQRPTGLDLFNWQEERIQEELKQLEHRNIKQAEKHLQEMVSLTEENERLAQKIRELESGPHGQP